jgi:hypothetical protein
MYTHGIGSWGQAFAVGSIWVIEYSHISYMAVTVYLFSLAALKVVTPGGV